MKKIRGWTVIILVIALAVSIAGCGTGKAVETPGSEAAAETTQKAESAQESTTAAKPAELKKIRVGYFGNTCEAPVFAAYEKGFFKEEGLDVEMIKGDANTLKDGLATGKVDITDGLLMQWLKPIEQGLNIKFTAGIHTGCIQILLPADSAIKDIKEFKGKTIGVPAIGGGPMILVSRLLAQSGLDPEKDVSWKAFPNAELPIALEKGEVDIISLADPFAQIQINEGKAKSFLNSAKHEPFHSEYCCLVVVNGTLLEKDPETAAAATRAIIKASKWVNENQQEIAQIEVDKKYVPGDPKVNADILTEYNYHASVEGGEKAVQIGAKEMKEVGILDKDTDTDALAKASFVRLEGVE